MLQATIHPINSDILRLMRIRTSPFSIYISMFYSQKLHIYKGWLTGFSHIVHISCQNYAASDNAWWEDLGATSATTIDGGLLSRGIRATAREAGIRYTFLFMSGNGAQLAKITDLIVAGIIRPVIDRVFPFEALNDAMTYVEAGRAKGKVIVRVL